MRRAVGTHLVLDFRLGEQKHRRSSQMPRVFVHESVGSRGIRADIEPSKALFGYLFCFLSKLSNYQLGQLVKNKTLYLYVQCMYIVWMSKSIGLEVWKNIKI